MRIRRLSIFLIFSCLCFYTNPIFATVNFNNNCKIAYSKMISLNLQGAKQIIDSEKKIDSKNLVPEFIDVYSQFLRVVFTENEKEYTSIIARSEKLISKLESEKQKSPYIGYLKADLHLINGMIYGFQKSQFSAMTALRRAFITIDQNHKEYPSFLPNNKLMGIMNITLGSIPKDYTWILDMFGMKGSVDIGLNQLNNLADKTSKDQTNQWLQSEALLLWSFMNLNFGDNEIGKNLTISKHQKTIDSLGKTSPLLCYSSASFYRKKGDNESVIKTLINFKTRDGHQKLHYLDLLLGEAYLYKMDATAIFYFNRYLKEYPGQFYKKSVLQKMGWFYLIQNNITQYNSYIRRILTEGAEKTEDDKKAQKEATSKIVPNPYLLKSRLLFDGGYYEEATRVFQTHNPNTVLKNEKESIEYNYRMGRIYDEWGKENQAIFYYKRAIEKGKDKTYYFAANAALHLGKIYEQQGNKAEAKKMFELCLSLDFDEYKTSITQKAKAELNRLEEK
jgi:tetratricopeptide (TPR) repeat protein